ncbi:MAG: hypothetical protein JSV89_09640 [Spirochaetaceae bacterium]|nr:MAG: hypothetical protein JSV89_09640 [Spirochaetaceae bacterium]
MKNFIRILVLIVFGILLVACDIFFIAKEGRYNPLDPKNEFVEVFPDIDGFADDTNWYQDDPLLSARNYTPMSVVYLRFTIDKIPDDFDNIYLRLYKYSSYPGVTIRIHPVILDKVPRTYSEAADPSFYDMNASTQHIVDSSEGFEYISLDPIIKGSKSRIRYGIVIFSDFESVDFISMEEQVETTWRPRLYISTQ